MICKAADTKLKALQPAVNHASQAHQNSDTPANRRSLADSLSRFIAAASPLLDALRALQPPSSDRVVVAKYLAGVAGQLSLYHQLVGAIESDKVSAVQTVSQQILKRRATVRGLDQGYGFKVCGNSL